MSPQRSGVETSIRQLIANGKSKTALDNAKEFHKKQRDPASETLLIDAYLARIQALSDQNLAVEAKSLIGLVRERFPAAKERLDTLNATAAARGGALDELLRPLGDPGLSAERRASIEQFIQNEITDLAVLAGCEALPAEHGLRKAAAAIDLAFSLVTSGPVTDEQIVLREVSHRSPLAPWKLLIRAIACFYRYQDGGDQDQACEEYLAAIRPESAPWRLVRAMRAMIGAKPGAKSPADLKPSEAALVSRTSVNPGKLRETLANLDRAFAHEEPGRIFKAVRAAVQECNKGAPDLLPELRRTVFVKGEVACLDSERMTVALEGAPRRDAIFFRDLALALEHTGDSEDLIRACEWWDAFRQEAVIEGMFAERSLEVAALYLHMASLLGRMPPELLRELQRPFGKPVSKKNYFVFPEELYGRGCMMDPHPDAFSQWLRWARGVSIAEAEAVARAWAKALPNAIEPLLFLMEQAEGRNAFPTAISYLDKAERIDAVNSTVRTARLRLLTAAAMRNLQQKKPHLAAERLTEIEALPQSRQGDRPAFVATLRFLICLASDDKPGGDRAMLEIFRAFGEALAVELLLLGCAAVAKMHGRLIPPPPDKFTQQQRAGFPASIARAVALIRDIGLASKFQLPAEYFEETEAQFPGAAGSLNVEQIRELGELGIATKHFGLAWEASAAGLDRGGAAEAYFLLLRARALPDGYADRYDALTAAAAELSRFHRDMEVIDRAVEAGRDPFDDTPFTLTLDQARDVLAKEKASPAFPSRNNPGPDYSSLFGEALCMCPGCRSERGEFSDPYSFEEDGEPIPDLEEMERSFYAAAPKDVPREMLPALFEVAKQAFFTGQEPEDLLSEIFASTGGRKKKGKRR